MDDEQIYIEQETAEDALYTHLQEYTLSELQRLSGKVWTDFNVHDPGVTLADAANYVLTEMNYKLGFGLPDYLADKQGKIDFEKYGLFHAKEVYTTAPVTTEDYRKLFIVHFPEAENIQVETDAGSGNYNIRVVLSPFEEENKGIEKEIRNFFHVHRNLCENIQDVIIVKPQQLIFEAEFEIGTGYDATSILAKVYWTIILYISGSIEITPLEKSFFSNLSPEEWMEGTYDGTRVAIPEQKDTEHELYLRLCKVTGIKSFRTCYLKNNGKIQTDFKNGFSLFIPHNLQELKVKITVGNSKAKVDIERLVEELQALYYTGRASCRKEEDMRTSNDGEQVENTLLPTGTYRDIFSHYPIGMDLPGCYQTCFDVNKSLTTPEVKKSVRQFDAYLKLYDLLAERGLKEVKELKSLLSIEKNRAILSEMEIIEPSVLIEEKNRYRSVYALKSKYLDFLDGLYGIESSPCWMEEFNYYGDTENERLSKRMDFLRNVAFLTKYRGKARNIKEWRDGENIPTVKKHVCYLLGMNMNEEISVGNVLPSHNLALLGTEKEGRRYRDKLNAMMISERMLDQVNISRIEQDPLLDTEDIPREEYEKLREELDIFNSNFISGGLFRGGINLNNYKLVKANEKEFLLVFWNEEEEVWMNLERNSNKKKLKKQANILRCYLRELNRQCETVYVIEHNLLTPPLPFTLSFVFPKWTARFQSLRFREICGDLVRSLISPHLKASLYWLDIPEMQFFEKGYRLWRKALANELLQDDIKYIEKDMMEILKNSEDKNKNQENNNRKK